MKDHEERETICSCRYCGGSHRRGDCPAYGQTCKKSSRRNHFSQVCLQSNSRKRHLSANIVTHSQQLSDEDSGDSIMTLNLSPEPADEVLVVQSKQFKLKIHMTMKIKGGSDTISQVDQLTAKANWKMLCTANKPTK